MAFDFPDAPTDGQIFNPLDGLKYRYSTSLGLWETVPYAGTAAPFNIIVNPNHAISQEYGSTAVAANFMAADQWLHNANLVGATLGRIASVTPKGSANRLRFTVNTAKASLAASDYVLFDHRLEGTRIAPLRWGSANAVPAVVRLTIKASVVGNYSFHIRNVASTRQFHKLLPVYMANVDTEIVFSIPAETSGVWASDTAPGAYIYMGLAVGTTYIAPSNDVWLTSGTNYLGANGMSNGMATLSSTHDFSDFGLYADPDNTGLPPKWQAPDELANMTDCLRYWYPLRSARGASDSAVLGGRLAAQHPVTMRVNPTLAVAAGNVCYMWDYGASGTISSINGNFSNTYHVEYNGNTAGTLNTGATCLMLPEYPGYLSVSARM
jgi:hypothetical protein